MQFQNNEAWHFGVRSHMENLFPNAFKIFLSLYSEKRMVSGVGLCKVRKCVIRNLLALGVMGWSLGSASMELRGSNFG